MRRPPGAPGPRTAVRPLLRPLIDCDDVACAAPIDLFEFTPHLPPLGLVLKVGRLDLLSSSTDLKTKRLVLTNEALVLLDEPLVLKNQRQVLEKQLL